MTVALSCYSAVFARYALAVTPKNYLLFGCHVVNFTGQVTQGVRFVNYWYRGGREEALKAKAASGLTEAKDTIKETVADATKKVTGK